MALVMESADREEMQQVAIEEWMAASPVYSRRMQRAMAFAGDGIDTICKNLQLDIGAPHEFMDFRFRILDDRHAEFWLAHCGALMDVEPMGVEFVHGMCHTIEDPTFDATAAATNPHAAIRPLHRPPRVPAGRTPHCHWRIDIDADTPAVEPRPLSARVAASLAARVATERFEAVAEPDGLADYSGPFDPELRLEDLGSDALRVALQEFALQSHLLLRGFLLSVEGRFGADRAAAIAPRLVAGWCGLTAQRLRDALGLEPTAAGLAAMLSLHPMFAPRTYVGATFDVDDEVVRIGVRDCPALQEGDSCTWVTGLGGQMDAALGAVVSAFDPHASCVRAATAVGEVHAYEVTIDRDSPAAPEVPELAIAKISTGAAFRFRNPTAKLSDRRGAPALVMSGDIADSAG